jgi:uncharacterized repeat protein (TIGR02543 family)
VTLIDGSSTFAITTVTFNGSYTFAVPTKSGYTFMGWFDEVENGTQYTDKNGSSISVWSNCGDKILYAQWKQNCSVTLTQNSSKAGTVNGSGDYAYGSSVNVTATTNTGYTFLGWYENGSLVSSNANYTFTVSANKSLEARWEINAYTVSTTKNISAAGSVLGDGTYDYGSSVTVKAITNSGYEFI